MDATLREWYLTDGRLDRVIRRIEDAAEGRGGVRLKTLAIAFTRYDRMFIDNPYRGLARARDRDVAQECVLQALERCTPLRDGLRRLRDIAGLRIIGIPVSTFGFVRGDGRPNFDPWLEDEDSTEAANAKDTPDDDNAPAPASMLTRPDIYCELMAQLEAAPGQTAKSASGAAMMAWLRQHWCPFLTADPFIACVSGESHELVFDLADLLERTPMRGAAYR